MSKRIKASDLEGKTIKTVINRGSKKIILVFTDGSEMVMVAGHLFTEGKIVPLIVRGD